MRIAVISRTFARTGGGAESYAVALVQQLAVRHDIHVFAQETDLPVPGVSYHRIFRLCEKPRWINQLLFAIATWLKTRRGFDVVHSHENTWHGQVQTVHVRPLRYNLLALRTGWHRWQSWLKIVTSPRLITYVWLEAARFKPVAGRAIVAASQGLRAECELAYPRSTAALSVITPGTALPINLPAREVARTQLGLPPDGRLLLFVANDYARKGLDALLQAMAQLPSDVRLAIAGSPRQVPKYQPQVERLGLAQRVYFLGSLKDLSPVYAAADCLAHPTLEDSFAMVVLEAMAHGLPVVVSGPAHCGISQQLTDGTDALLLVNPKDSKQLSECISAVLSKPELAAQLRQHGLAFAQAHSWESAALQYEALYQQAASQY